MDIMKKITTYDKYNGRTIVFAVSVIVSREVRKRVLHICLILPLDLFSLLLQMLIDIINLLIYIYGSQNPKACFTVVTQLHLLLLMQRLAISPLQAVPAEVVNFSRVRHFEKRKRANFMAHVHIWPSLT